MDWPFKKSVRNAKLWLQQPVGGPTLAEIHKAESSEGEPDSIRGLRDFTLVEGQPESRAPSEPLIRSRNRALLASVELEVYARDEDDYGRDVSDERGLPPLLARVTATSGELHHRFAAATFRWLGPDVRCGHVEVTEGSVVVRFPLWATAGLPDLVAESLDELVDAAQQAVRDVLGPNTISRVTGYWEPGPALRSPAPAKEAPPTPERGDRQIGKWLVTAGAFAIAALAVIKVSEADLVRARLNHSFGVSAAFGVIVFAVLVGVLWPAWLDRGGVSRFVMTVLTLVVAGVGAAVVLIVWFSNESLSKEVKPDINVQLKHDDAGTHLVGDVHADGVANDRHLFVGVRGVANGRATILYSTQLGADREGKADASLDLLVPEGRFAELETWARAGAGAGSGRRCPADEGSATGCVRVRLPGVASRPRLSVAWKLPTGAVPRLSLSAGMQGLASDDRMLVSVLRGPPRSPLGGRIYAATFTPRDDGSIAQEVVIPVRRGTRSVCVIARVLRGDSGSASATDGGYGPCHARVRGVSAVLVQPPR